MTEADLHTGLDNYSNKNDYKADVSALATEANATTNKDSIITEVNANETKIDSIISSLPADTTVELTLIQALLHRNFRITPATYDAVSKRMATGTFKAYPTANDAENDTNELIEIDVTATYDANGRMTLFKSKEV